MSDITDKTIASGAPRILVSGGGTGGHIFPALAIADAIKRRCPDAEFLFVGAEGRMEMERVPAAGYRIVGLPVAGFDRRRLWRNFSVVIKLIRSMRRARKVLADFRPDIAIGVGGYASGPMLKEAQRRGVPTLLQEQNSYAGVTNKLLGGKADKVCVAYEGMDRFFPASKIVLTGNPVRRSLTESQTGQNEAKRQLGFPENAPMVVVTGGSLGAATINRSMISCIAGLHERGISVLWQTGRLYYKEFAHCADTMPGVRVVEFITDMNLAYSAADLVVARAGASTISELQWLGKPALLIPSPNVAEDHQRKNAMALVDRGAAVMLPDDRAASGLGPEIIRLIDDPGLRQRMSESIKAMAPSQASDEVIASYVFDIIEKNKSE